MEELRPLGPATWATTVAAATGATVATATVTAAAVATTMASVPAAVPAASATVLVVHAHIVRRRAAADDACGLCSARECPILGKSGGEWGPSVRREEEVA